MLIDEIGINNCTIQILGKPGKTNNMCNVCAKELLESNFDEAVTKKISIF